VRTMPDFGSLIQVITLPVMGTKTIHNLKHKYSDVESQQRRK